MLNVRTVNNANAVNNSVNETVLDFGTSDQKFYSLVSGAVQCGLWLPAAATVIFLVASRPDFRRITQNLILINLLLTEGTMLITISTLGIYSQYYFNVTTCAVAGFISYASGLAAWLNYFILSFDRYTSLFHGDRFEQIFERRRIWISLLISWLVTSLLLIPYQVTGTAGFEEMQFCGMRFDGIWWRILYDLIVLHAVLLGTSYIASLYCNYKIYWEMTTKKAPFGFTGNIISEFRSELRLLILYGALPAVLQFPFAIAKSVPQVVNYPWLGRALTSCYLWNLTISPYLVLFFLKPFRSATLALLGVSKYRRLEEEKRRISATSKGRNVAVEFFLDSSQFVR